ncbi:MAG: hypothetical protein CMP10_11960 [Zetaproteobacteria bacterium]|nr:hypothetical protein [Pseudobdellovibrionaceae bacterium]
MSEKVVNLKALKDKAQTAGKKASSGAKDKISKAGQKIRDTASNRGNRVLSKVLNKGIALTEKQLKSLKNMKKNRNSQEDRA